MSHVEPSTPAAPGATSWYQPGERWLVVTERAIVVSHGTSADAMAIWRVAMENAGAGDLLAASIRGTAAPEGWSDPDPFAIAVAEPGGVRVLVRAVDGVVVRTADGSETTLGAPGLVSWTEDLVPDAVEVRIGDAAAAALPVPAGVVRAGAVRWQVPAVPSPISVAADHPPIEAPERDELPDEAGAGPVPGAGGDDGLASPAVEPATFHVPEGDHDGLTQFAEDLPVGYTPPPLPTVPPPGTVLAALCPMGHPNAPHSRSCRLCGQPIPSGDPVPVPRPVLARIRVSTGDVVEVDRAVVLGRAPYAPRPSDSELPRLVEVPSPNQDISRAHTEIRPEDWHLVVADLDSTNGTVVHAPGRTPQRLRPGQEVVVEPGWSVDLGEGVSFLVEAV